MDLDEEDFEALGYGQFDVSKSQKLSKSLAELGLLPTGSWTRNTVRSKDIPTISWKQRFPEKVKAINKKYSKTIKGRAAAARRNKKYRSAGKGKNGQAKRQQKHYQTIKADPIKYAKYKAKKAKEKRDRRRKAKLAAATTTKT